MACPLPFWGPTTGPIRLETTEQVGAAIGRLQAEGLLRVLHRHSWGWLAQPSGLVQ